MNILFYNVFGVSPTRGGTERITYSVASSLRNNYGHNVFSVYSNGNKDDYQGDLFSGIFKMPQNNIFVFLQNIIKDNEIDCIIVQGAFLIVRLFREVLGTNSHCKLLFAHHFEPGWELNFNTFKYYKYNFIHSKRAKNKFRAFIHVLLYPYERMKYVNSVPNQYFDAYNHADHVILLSKKFIPMFGEFAGLGDESKFCIIPNMLSYNEILSPDFLEKKKKKVLVVSRMEEDPKRISLVLKIWQKCKKDKRSEGWHLDVVGDGPDLGKYIGFVKSENIPDVTFHGRKPPLSYYKEASLFFMTSKSEGWGLTLTESQQNGVVPLAFEYTCLNEIIHDGSDGVIIKGDDIGHYVDCALMLMSDEQKLLRTASNALENSKRFSSIVIGKEWNTFLNGI